MKIPVDGEGVFWCESDFFPVLPFQIPYKAGAMSTTSYLTDARLLRNHTHSNSAANPPSSFPTHSHFDPNTTPAPCRP